MAFGGIWCVKPTQTDNALASVPKRADVTATFRMHAGQVLVPYDFASPDLIELLTWRPSKENAPTAAAMARSTFTLYVDHARTKHVGMPPAFVVAAFPNATIEFPAVAATRDCDGLAVDAGGPVFSGTLLPWQEEACNVIVDRLTTHASHAALLNASCGCGKTPLGFAVAARLGLPLLWLSPAKLVSQTTERARQFCDAAPAAVPAAVPAAAVVPIAADPIAVVPIAVPAATGLRRKRRKTAANVRPTSPTAVLPSTAPPSSCVGVLWGELRPHADARICVASLSTLAQMPVAEALAVCARYKTVIVDETHGLPCRTFSHALSTCTNAKYRLGLTATIERPDGNADPISYLTGGLCFRAEKSISAVVHVIHYHPPHFEVVFNKHDGRPEPNKALDALVNDATRTALHAAVLRRAAAQFDKTILHLSKRTKYLTDLHAMLGEDLSGLVVGVAKSAAQLAFRRSQLDKRIVLCAFRIGRDGLDCAAIGGVGYGLPVQMEGSLTQSVGRTDRDAEGKADKPPSLVLDFVDEHWLFAKNKRIHQEYWQRRGFAVVHHTVRCEQDAETFQLFPV